MNERKELQKINRNITRLNLIGLVGLMSYLKSRVKPVGPENVAIRVCAVLASIALFLNGIIDLTEEIGSLGAKEDEVQ